MVVLQENCYCSFYIYIYIFVCGVGAIIQLYLYSLCYPPGCVWNATLPMLMWSESPFELRCFIVFENVRSLREKERQGSNGRDVTPGTTLSHLDASSKYHNGHR